MSENSGTFQVALRLPSGSLTPVKSGGKTMTHFTRKAARLWCKKNYDRLIHSGMVLVDPEGKHGEFVQHA